MCPEDECHCVDPEWISADSTEPILMPADAWLRCKKCLKLFR